MRLHVHGGSPLRGSLELPADKSLTHRALILSALAQGTSRVTARDAGEDNHSTARVIAGLGVSVEHEAGEWRVRGVGPRGLTAPAAALDCGNSGTTMRLMAGVLTGAGVPCTLVGDASLSRRPMGRICKPLRALGGAIDGGIENGRELPPLVIEAGAFAGGSHRLEIASAQVKSALLLAGLTSGKAVEVIEPVAARDHTERLLAALGAPLHRERRNGAMHITLGAQAHIGPLQLTVPGDFSSAAFFIAAATLVAGSEVSLRNVGVNPTRTGLLEILEELGASVRVSAWREEHGEPVGDLHVAASSLRAVQPGDLPTVVAGDVVPRLVDELVVLGAIASQAEGTVEIRDASELRVKESDRIDETVRLLGAFGVQAEARPDGIVVTGPQPLKPARVDVSSDHRIALTAAVLALAAPGESVLEGFEIAAVSYPSFVRDLEQLGAKLVAK